jgi:hypothetical protein
MSLYELTSSTLSLKPRVWFAGRVLHVRTNGLLRFLSGFSYCREIEVDPESSLPRIQQKTFWMRRPEQQIRFEDIAYLDYGFGSFVSDFEYLRKTDQVEKFTISIVLKETEDKIPLTSFSGEGSVATGWGGVLVLGDDWVDARGDQEEASASFVDTLRAMLDVPLGKPVVHVSDGRGGYYFCTKCARPSPPRRAKCQYCGGRVKKGGVVGDVD